MNVFLKVAAGVLISLIIWLSLEKQSKDISVLLTIAVCAMIVIAAMNCFRPVMAFFEKIQDIGNLDRDLLSIILKVVGIGLITEICTLICKDAGNESMGKGLQILSTVVVLLLSIPVFEKLLTLLDKILGAV